MKRLLAAAVTFALVLCAVALSRGPSVGTKEPTNPDGLQVKVEKQNPWNHLKLNNTKGTFRFAIVSDRTGGARPGVFDRAVEQLNWLQPEFVVSVGDLIEGSPNLEKVDKQWEEFNGFIAKLEMPFFYVPGNHDYANKTLAKRWNEQFGRNYYHFVYKDVLFLLLNTEDGGGKTKGLGKFGEEQIAYVKKVLQENKNVRWTLLFFHKPVWTYKDVGPTGLLEIEAALNGRKYTVFTGHVHRYQTFERQGQHYYQLATTGGSSRMRGPGLGEFDHIVWVTMKQDGPVLANLMMEGIFPRDMKMAAAPVQE